MSGSATILLRLDRASRLEVDPATAGLFAAMFAGPCPFVGMTTYRARAGDSQKDDATLCREMLEIVFKAPEWLRWNQAPGEAIQFTVPRLKMKGLLRIQKGEREWWPYLVDRQRLRSEGPRAIARSFLDGYEQARKS